MNIQISLIHHQDEFRLVEVTNTIDALLRGLKEYHTIERSYFYYQPKLSKLDPIKYLGLQFVQYSFKRKWNKYISEERPQHYEIFIKDNSTLARASIERYLRHKHLLAWRHFIQSESDYLLVLEDDCYLKVDSVERLHKIILSTAKFDSRVPQYIDLAGGFPLKAVLGNVASTWITSDLEKPELAISNTTCCYLINRASALVFCDLAESSEVFEALPIDWFLNAIFLTLHETEAELICLHSSPPVFIHGSMGGSLASSVQVV